MGLHAASHAAETGSTLEIKLGETVERTWEQVKAEDFVYGSRQEFDEASGETHIWLPYGSNAPYYEVTGLKLSDPGLDGIGAPLIMSINGTTSGQLIYKLHFDKPISEFRIYAGWSEWGVKESSVGGVEYSTDGEKWTSIREINKPGIVEPFVGADAFKATGLKTQDLYLRFYSRDKNDTESRSGSNRWMKFRMGGDPAWGDASTTFFAKQFQIWAKQ